MTEPAPSPLPWRVDKVEYEGTKRVYIAIGEGIDEIYIGKIDHRADAEFIVHCVNSHATLTAERDEARARADRFQRERAELSDKLNGTPCAEIRWEQEHAGYQQQLFHAESARDAALAEVAALRQLLFNAGQIMPENWVERRPAPELQEGLAAYYDAMAEMFDDQHAKHPFQCWDESARNARRMAAGHRAALAPKGAEPDGNA